MTFLIVEMLLRCNAGSMLAPHPLQALHLLVTATHPTRCHPASVAASMADALPLLGALASSSKSMVGINWGLDVLPTLYKMQFMVVKQVCQLVVDFVASCKAQERVEELKQQQQQAGGSQVQVPLEKQQGGEPSGPSSAPLPLASPRHEQQQQQKGSRSGSKRKGSLEPRPATAAALASLVWAALRIANVTGALIIADIQTVKLLAVDRKTLSIWARKAAAEGRRNARLLARLAAMDPAPIQVLTATKAVLLPALLAAAKQQQQEEEGQGVEPGSGAAAGAGVLALVSEFASLIREFGSCEVRRVYRMAFDKGALPDCEALNQCEAALAQLWICTLDNLDLTAAGADGGRMGGAEGGLSAPSHQETHTALPGGDQGAGRVRGGVAGNGGGFLSDLSLAGCVTGAGLALQEACAALQLHQESEDGPPGSEDFTTEVLDSIGKLGGEPWAGDMAAAFLDSATCLSKMPVSFSCNSPPCRYKGSSSELRELGWVGERSGQAKGVCKGCRTAVYCCSACQEEHWPYHKAVCQQLQKERRRQKRQQKLQQKAL
jgi:hypothetical protein